MIRTPKKYHADTGFFVPAGQNAVLHFAPQKKMDYLIELCGLNGFQLQPDEHGFCLTVGEVSIFPAVTLCGDEAFALQATESSLCLCANSETGISQGLKWIAAQLLENDLKLPCCTLQDAPDVDFRAAHLCIFYPEDGTEKESTEPEDIRRRLKILSLCGYNYAFLEFWGMFPYEKRPYACWPNTRYTRKVVQDLIDYAIDDLHITPLPAQNLTSHAGWSRIISRKHVVLDQRPDLADMWIPGGWCFATENPDTQAYLRDLMDDLIKTFRNPPMLHASCDKCFGFGSTEEDRTHPADVLFVNHLCRLNSYLSQKGVRMVMWGDMIYSSMDALYWKADSRMADILPKNILINIWTHNDVGTHWADVDFFESRGFETVYSPFLNIAGAESMVRICKQKKSFGMVQTTWHRPESTLPTVVITGALCYGSAAPETSDINRFLARV